MQDLILLTDTVFKIMKDIFNLYLANFILTGVLALWLIRKVVNIFKHL